ncbi:MAG TPA: ABC transporter ATP-binding protein [Candidatus Aenigmarchaeota archaeon]|nr:ABC transporter ATP-binding protein [Candidatus Aenigmarchaeota archaeon]
MSRVLIELRNVEKIYNEGKENEVRALKGVSLKIHEKDFIAIIGPSGSGKSTLLHMLGCLDKPTKGKVLIDGKDVSKMNDEDLARIRREKIGFIFQTFNLIPTLTALENVELPMKLNGKKASEARERAKELLKIVGLEKRLDHLPSQLSGGEQQRVAIARALANEPEIILADEPTGNLDSKTGFEIVKLMKKLNREGYTFVIVTHDLRIADFANKKIRIKDGKLEV